jgi:hypothetical protein
VNVGARRERAAMPQGIKEDIIMWRTPLGRRVRRAIGTVALVLLAAGIASAQITVYTPQNAPPTPAPADLPLQASVSRHGITWHFSAPARVGQFINGDYYVLGPVTVSSIDPAPTSNRNGTVINLPPLHNASGFDDRVSANRWDPSLRTNPPFTLQPGDSAISSISVATVGTTPRILRSQNNSGSPVKTIAVLTCLAAPVAADAFRPTYADASKTIYYSRNLRRDYLPSLPRPGSTPPLSTYEGWLGQTWLDAVFFGFDAPTDNQPDYGRELARLIGMAGLQLCLDYTPAEKEPLLIYLLQYGIDQDGLVRAGHSGWPAHGGHGQGRKLPIVMAGWLLDDEAMAAPDTRFGEDIHTMYDLAWQGATVVYSGHTGAAGTPGRSGWGAYEHLQPSQWLDDIGEDYRRCCTSVSFVGLALAARLIGAKDAWDHPALFSYADRWMTEDDTEDIAIIQQQIGRSYSAGWQRQGQTWDNFSRDMYVAHRFTAAEIVEAPRHATVNQGASARFDVTARGVAPVTYQWKRNGEDIPGATGASYTLSSTGSGDDGAEFQVAVTNGLGSETSRPAVLTVRGGGAPGDTTKPTVSLASPSGGSTLSGVVAVTANASDNVGVVVVDFLIDGKPVWSDTSAPYEFSWNTGTVGDSTHNIGSIARDGAGNQGDVWVDVRVNNGADPIPTPTPGPTPTPTPDGSPTPTPTPTPDPTPLPPPAISISGVSLTEGNSGTKPATFQVTLSHPTDDAVTVDFETVDGTATVAGMDYLMAAGRIAFEPGETSASIVVTIVGDAIEEPTESFTVLLFAPVNATIATGEATGVIQNDDGVLNEGLILFHPFSEGAGATANDASGYDHHGSIAGGAAWSAADPLGGLRLDGVDDYVTVANTATLQTVSQDFTISLWMWATNSGFSTGGAEYLIDKGGLGTGFYIRTYGDGSLLFKLDDGTDDIYAQTDDATPTNGALHHIVAVVRGRTAIEFYVDGALQSGGFNGPLTSIGSISNAENLVIGATSAGASRFDGYIDDVRIYNRALSVTEIRDLLPAARSEPVTPAPTPGPNAARRWADYDKRVDGDG